LKPYEKLQHYWAATDTPFHVAPPEQLTARQLERKYDVQLPKDFRDYLELSCPTDEETFDEPGTSWWPLARIKSIVEEYEYPVENPEVAECAAKYLFFADFMLWCWAWAIDCSDGKNRGRIAVIGGGDRFVADSFSEFVDKYLEDPRSVA
jgi:hypothetical protein